MTLTLTLVRHGQTTLNARRHLQGACDSPLTRTGRAGVRVTAQHLADRSFDAVYSSPQGRAVQTAAEILQHHPGHRLRIEEGLRELSFGSFERRPERTLDAEVPWSELVPAMLAGTHPGVGGGESGGDFMDRVRSVFARIVAAHAAPDGGATGAGRADGKHVLVVGHGLTLAAYLWTVEPSRLAALPNASVSTVEVSDGVTRVVQAGVDVAGHGAVAARPAPVPAAAAR
ncbi:MULTISPECIES: histidine phosphatase family protein [unclassified Isoptericola]|uniref:histidine phosphatase family protein n=1 Tax=unclassified Isoptericola TaxID=2623355 RepID=UPI002712FDFA|nr:MULTISPECIES: histidine phosphatase family protein [unclassified Isoptericola]MDO8148362.1 histidine phosphatase family protein [Isoptericola sp. b515]MDO8151843.1 histidine phosphatase family protein [Isoptericola sp. b408]